MSEFGANQEFHPSGPVISKHYNYTVDYFELRAQPGRDGTALPSDDQYWYRDEITGVLYPLYIDDGVVVGGSSLVGTEKLRVVGDLYADGSLLFPGGYIETSAGELIFYDNVHGAEVTLSDLLTTSWTRDGVNGWLRPTNSADDILMGLQTGSALRRLQIRSEGDDGTSYLIYGENSIAELIFSVTDQGHVRLDGDLYFSADDFIRESNGFSFHLGGTSYVNLTSSYLGGEGATTWRINYANPYYSFANDTDTGLGLVGDGQPAIFIGGSNLYNFTATQFSLPQEAWIYASRNLLRVNSTSQIELGSFTFDDSANLSMFFRSDAYMYVDPLGGMWFADNVLGQEISLSELANMANVYWERDNVQNIVYPLNAGDTVRLPALATGDIESLFIDAQGTLIVGGIPEYVFSNDINVVLSAGKSLGKYTNGETIPATGLNIEELMWDIAQEYLNPYFTSFSVSGQSTMIEVGTTLSGSRTFTWSINEESGDVNFIDVYDITDGSDLLTYTPNDGSEIATITTYQLNSDGATQQWRGIGYDETPDPDESFNSSPFTVISRFYRFYGAVAASPTDSASVRALPDSAFQSSAAQIFILNTGTTYTKFVVALPPGYVISSVIDLDALNLDITSEYVQQSDINVLDAGSTNRSYNIYEMNIAVTYLTNHRHQITTSSE